MSRLKSNGRASEVTVGPVLAIEPLAGLFGSRINRELLARTAPGVTIQFYVTYGAGRDHPEFLLMFHGGPLPGAT